MSKVGDLIIVSTPCEPASRSIIEIRPHRGGWQCFEGDGVAPYFVGDDSKRQAIDYATQRMRARTGEIRVVDASGKVDKVIPFWK